MFRIFTFSGGNICAILWAAICIGFMCEIVAGGSEIKSAVHIESPHLTNWGSWGYEETCPEGTYGGGMSLKSESYQGDGDDTALNGIRILCITPGTNDFNNAVGITSSMSGWGAWGKSYYCDKGLITGFQLRSEGEQKSGDNTAANNLRIFCSNLEGGFLEGDAHSWGLWTEAQRCLSQQAVCGIQTQAQSYQGDGDDSAVNNVRMKCCDVENIAKTCNPKDEWETVFECDNKKGSEPLTCTYEKSRGISKSNTASESTIEEYNIMLSLGFSTSALYSGLSANFKYNLSSSATTGYSWASEASQTWSEVTTTTAQFVVPGGMRSKLSQAVGTCGFFGVFSNYFRKEDFNCSNALVSLNYFHD